jgi:ankyrin repeat protein
MRELKYPPGVRFVFLLLLSLWIFIFIGTEGSSSWPDQLNNLIFAITSTVSLALLIIGLLPWAKKRRARALIPGLVLFLSGLPFFVEIVLIPAVFGLCAIILFLSRYGPVAVDQRRPVGILGYILLGLTFLITPVLTVFSIILVEETRADEVLLLITPAWLLFSGIILKIAGSGKKNLAPIKPLLFSGELSVLFSFPLFAFLAVAENSRGDKEMFYAIALGSSVIFSLCVLFRGLLGNWLCGLLFGKPEPKISMVDKENTGLPPLIATPVRKPAMFLSNYGGVVVMGGLAVLGLFGFVIGLFFDSLVDAYKASPVPVGIEPSFEGGWNGMLTAIWAPFALVLSPLSLFGGIYVLCWAIQHTRRYWYGWVGLILLALASPFLLVLGHTITESIFAKPDAVALVAQEEEEEIEEQWPAGVDRDDDGFDDYDEFLTGHDPQDPNDTPKLMEVEEAISEFHWEDSDEDGFDDYDEHIVGTDPTNSEDTPTQEQVDAALAERETVLAKEEADAAEEQREAQAKALEPLPGHDPSNLQGNYGIKKIHLAVLRGDLADTQAQVSTNADINAPDEVGNTPLHLALGLSETMIAEWLISQGADLQAKTNDGRAVVHAAAAGGQLELLKKLVAEGLKLDTKNALGQGPLHLACAAGQTETIEWLFGQGQTATAPDANGNTPLHMAVIHGRVGLVKPLIDAGADLKQLNTLGEAAIHLACTNGQVGLVNWMLEQDATLANLPDGDRFTPLYHAAINGNSRTVSLLLTHKAEIKAGDNAELGELFAKVLADNVEYFERFEEQMNPFGGMGMGMMGMMPFGMGMPGMGMNPYGMMGMGGMGMPEFDEEEFEGIGVDSDEDGFDDYDENLVGTDPEDPDDTPTQEQVDTAQAEKDAAEIAEDDAANLLVEDESSDESEMDPEEEEEAMPDFGGLPGTPTGMMPGLNPNGMGNPFGMPGMQRGEKKDAPKPKDRRALMGADTNGNTVMHLVAAIGSSQMVEAATNIPELSREDTNQLGFTPPDLVKALGREEVAPHLADYEDAYGGMGGMYGMGMGMMGMPGMMPYGMGMPGMGMNPYGMMGMGGMGMQGMRENESKKTNLFPPLKKPLDLWRTESDIGVDSDEDGFDDHDEKLTGHDPENPNDTPTQKEVDAAKSKMLTANIQAFEEEQDDEFSSYDEFASEPGNPAGGMGMVPYGMMGMEMETNRVEVQVKDELELRSVAQKRVPTAGQPRSFFEQVITNKGELYERQKISGLFHQATDPQTGYSALKWMELLNRNLKAPNLADANPEDAALDRLRTRETARTSFGANGEPLLHRLAREGNVYQLSFALARNPDPNLMDGRGRTALHVAAASGRVSLMKQLLSLGADPAVVDQYGFTALHWAAQNGQLETARHLVEEVKVERVADRLSRSPAVLAKSRGHAAVSDYLSAN